MPGLTPRSPTMVLEPVFVTVDPPRTPNVAAVPRLNDCALIRIGNAKPQTAVDLSLILAVMSTSCQGFGAL